MLTEQDLADLKRIAAKFAQSDLDLRGPKESEDIQFQFMHAVEEISEAFKCWREGLWDGTVTLDKYGLPHPEGLGSEIADTIGLAFVLASLIGRKCQIDVWEALRVKHAYICTKARAKAVESSKPIRLKTGEME